MSLFLLEKVWKMMIVHCRVIMVNIEVCVEDFGTSLFRCSMSGWTILSLFCK